MVGILPPGMILAVSKTARHFFANGKFMLVYIHVPFCRTRCRYCACHSIPLGRGVEPAATPLLRDYLDTLQLEPSEFELIKYPERGTCLYRCGNERYLLQVIAPDYKAALFGKAGGR